MMDLKQHGINETEYKSVNAPQRPPVVLDMQDETYGHATVVDYLKSLSLKGNVEVAREEAARLTPFFKAYSRRLADLNALENSLDSIRVIPETLSEIFVDAARGFKNTILSEVMILPHKTIQTELMDCEFIDHNTYDIKSHYNGRKINFGFLQVLEKDNDGKMLSSTGLPVMTLDREFMDVIKSNGGKTLLDNLQTVMSWGNHDMLHHYTSRIVTAKAALKIELGHESNVTDWYSHYVDTSTVYSSPLDYERWAILSYMQTWKAMDGDTPEIEVHEAIDGFLDALGNIADTMKEKDDLCIYQQHAVIDYFGMVMALAMSRLISIDHDDFENYFNRLKEIDPDPEAVKVDLMKGKEIAKELCKELDKQQGSENAGYRFFVDMMENSGLQRDKLFKRSLFSLSEITGLDRQELLDMDEEEFCELWVEELEQLNDSVFEERLQWDIRGFVAEIFNHDKPQEHDHLAKIAAQNFPLFIQKRENVLNMKINNGEGIFTAHSNDNKPDSKITFDIKGGRAADDYAVIKKLQLAGLVPSVIYLHSKPQKGTRLAQAYRQLDKQDHDMVRAVVRDLRFTP